MTIQTPAVYLNPGVTQLTVPVSVFYKDYVILQCQTTCTYVYDDAFTPVVDSIVVDEAGVITVTGSNFNGPSAWI